jgi:hypothetical protein
MWAAETHRLPSSFLTRVLWLESGFRTVCENGSQNDFEPGRALEMNGLGSTPAD